MTSEEPSTTSTPVDGDDSSNLSKNALKKKLKAEKAAAAKAAKAKAKVSRLKRRKCTNRQKENNQVCMLACIHLLLQEIPNTLLIHYIIMLQCPFFVL
jgi:hypothetical protein